MTNKQIQDAALWWNYRNSDRPVEKPTADEMCKKFNLNREDAKKAILHAITLKHGN